jgi:8-oxo-dGTP pyrophosphatase MutT (NUDIX family)
MRFEEVLRRLEALPAILPEGPAALVPILADTGGRRAARLLDGAGAPREAAVLVLFFPDETGAARLVLTERTDRGGHHSGEVSFPGGRAEPDDPDIVATALREAHEEVGLDPEAAGLRIVGTLPTLRIPVSGFAVTPVIAVAARRPLMQPAPDEVARIIEAPVASFLPAADLLHVEREIDGWRLRYAAYPIDGLAVWGMTARVLGGLGAHLGTDQPPDRRIPE